MTALGLNVPQNRSEWTKIGGGKVSPRRLQAEKRESESIKQGGVKLTSGLRLLNKVQSQSGTLAGKLGASSFDILNVAQPWLFYKLKN